MNAKRIVIIAGSNGAGKTTFVREFMPNEAGGPIFLNADLIAVGPSPFTPDLAAFKAGRLMQEAISEHVAKGESFAFETTLAGLSYAQAIPRYPHYSRRSSRQAPCTTRTTSIPSGSIR